MSQYTQLLSGYLLDAFQHKLQTRSGVKLNIPPTLPSPTLSTELVAECEHISAALVDAFLNPGMPTSPFLHLRPSDKGLKPFEQVVIPWDAVRYADRLSPRESGRNEEREAKLASEYPPPVDLLQMVVDVPSIVVDMHGVILAWYLPQVLSPKCQVRQLFQILPTVSDLGQVKIWNASAFINHTMGVNQPKEVSEKSWRKSSEYYCPADLCKVCEGGCIDFSPAWFQQGHNVGTMPTLNWQT